jgi:uncharacterized membrane protein YoaK (UPF0700 family)
MLSTCDRSRPSAAAILSVAIIVAQFTRVTDLWQIAIVTIAMGIMNSSPASVGSQSVNLTVVTGTLNKIGRHLALGWAGTAGVRIRRACGVSADLRRAHS